MRAARGLIDWTQPDLAERSGVALATVKRMEKLGPARSSAGNVDAVQRALEAAGVIFIAENGEGPGVRLRRERDKPKEADEPSRTMVVRYTEEAPEPQTLRVVVREPDEKT